MIKTEEGARYKFVVDHHFIENAMKVPEEERRENPIWQILYFALAVKNEDQTIDVLWTTKPVVEYLEKMYPTKKWNDNFSLLHNFVLGHLISIDPIDQNKGSDIPTSLKNCASEEFGCKNFLLCDESIKKQVSEGGTSFEFASPEGLFSLIHQLKNELPFQISF